MRILDITGPDDWKLDSLEGELRKETLGNKHYETAEASGFLAMAYAASAKLAICSRSACG